MPRNQVNSKEKILVFFTQSDRLDILRTWKCDSEAHHSPSGWKPPPKKISCKTTENYPQCHHWPNLHNGSETGATTPIQKVQNSTPRSPKTTPVLSSPSYIVLFHLTDGVTTVSRTNEQFGLKCMQPKVTLKIDRSTSEKYLDLRTAFKTRDGDFCQSKVLRDSFGNPFCSSSVRLKTTFRAFHGERYDQEFHLVCQQLNAWVGITTTKFTATISPKFRCRQESAFFFCLQKQSNRFQHCVDHHITAPWFLGA